VNLAATLVQEVPADSGNLSWYMTDSIAGLDDSHSEVIMKVIDLALNWQLFPDVGRPRSFVNVTVTVFLCKHELWKCTYIEHRARVKLWGGGVILETNCIFKHKPPLHF